MKIREYMKENILLTDGAMGTWFDEKTGGEFLCSEEANLFQPDIIREIHQSYIEAGAHLIRSNTFSANRRTYREIMARHGAAVPERNDEEAKRLEADLAEGEDRAADDGFQAFVRAGFALAREAAQTASREGKTVFAAADIGPIYEDGESSTEETEREYREIVDAFLEEDADIFVMETFPDERYVLAMARYIREKKPDAFLIGQFSFVPTGYSRTGFHYKNVLKRAAESGLLDGIGLNCGIGAAHMERFLREYLEENGLPVQTVLTALPNCGYPQIVRGRAVYSDSVGYFGKKAAGLASLGVSILGGCCGTTPEYIREIAHVLQDGVSSPDGERFLRIRPTEGRRRAGKKADRDDLATAKKSVSEGREQHTEKKIVSEGRKQQIEKKAVSEKKHVADGETPAENTFSEKLKKGEPVIAVELDPPFDTDMKKLLHGARELMGTATDIITIADSPLARSRADSLLTAVKIRQETGMDVMPHLACRDRNRIALRSGLLGAYVNDIRNILVVTGDPVGREERSFTKSVFDFNSIKLMEFMESLNGELFQKEPMCYGGALNQNGAQPDKIAERMKRKIDAGCQFFLTQPVYSEEEVERLSYLQAKTGAKILVGIMPLVSYRNALFIKNEMPGIHVPDAVLSRYHPEGSREEWEQTALAVSGSVMAAAKDVGAGFYFMTPFHRVALIRRIMETYM